MLDQETKDLLKEMYNLAAHEGKHEGPDNMNAVIDLFVEFMRSDALKDIADSISQLAEAIKGCCETCCAETDPEPTPEPEPEPTPPGEEPPVATE